jgi:hypothetical protein
MSVEHGPQSSERNEQDRAELEVLRQKQLERLGEQPETGGETAKELADKARETIKQHEAAPQPAATEQQPNKPPQVNLAAHLDHLINYRDTMASMRRHLKPASRSFSKLIHAPAVEKLSEPLERTLMRPSVVAGATWSAAVVGIVFYFTARFYGFSLSGSEMLLALAGGAVLGLLIEAALRLSRRR